MFAVVVLQPDRSCLPCCRRPRRRWRAAGCSRRSRRHRCRRLVPFLMLPGAGLADRLPAVGQRVPLVGPGISFSTSVTSAISSGSNRFVRLQLLARRRFSHLPVSWVGFFTGHARSAPCCRCRLLAKVATPLAWSSGRPGTDRRRPRGRSRCVQVGGLRPWSGRCPLPLVVGPHVLTPASWPPPTTLSGPSVGDPVEREVVRLDGGRLQAQCLIGSTDWPGVGAGVADLGRRAFSCARRSSASRRTYVRLQAGRQRIDLEGRAGRLPAA